MPELPEVEIVKRSLLKFQEIKINNIKIINKNLRYKISDKLSKRLKNKKILKILRRSKYLIFKFKKQLLLAHLGMTGKFIINNKDNLSHKHDHIHFILNNGITLIYNDVRKFGFLKLYDTTNIKDVDFLSKLGPEPLNKFFDIKYFENYIKNKKKNVKNLLMDQKFVSGLGNIYVNESLFRSKIHPLRSCQKLNKQDIKNLVSNIKKVLTSSILKGGSSIENFKDIYGNNGNFQQSFYVYDRENEKCSRTLCQGKIKRFIVSGRSCFCCDTCQK